VSTVASPLGLWVCIERPGKRCGARHEDGRDAIRFDAQRCRQHACGL
jgi:hypothetical protein